MLFFFTFCIGHMNNLSKIKNSGIVLIIVMMLFGLVSADLIYNPETGTYTDDSGQNIDQIDEIWIPVDDSTPTVTDATVTATTATSVATSWDVATGAVDLMVTTDTPELIDLPQEEIVLLESWESIIDITEPTLIATTNTFQSVTIESLEPMLTDAGALLKAYLDQKAGELAWVYNSHISSRYGASFGELVECIGTENAVSQIQNEIQQIVSSLDTRIKTSSADLYADIASVTYKNNVWLLDVSETEIEATVIATNIDTFSQNYISLIDSYIGQASSSIIDFVDSEEAATYEEMLAGYLARRSKLDQLKQAFTVFENSSFFGQTVVWPRADELEALSNDIFTIFENDMLGGRGNRSPKDFKAMVAMMRVQFDGHVENTIEELFPYGDIDGLYKSYTLITDIYGLDEDTYKCREILANKSVDVTWPELIEKIQTAQEKIAIAQSAVWWASSREELQEWLSNILLSFYQDSLRAQYDNAYASAEIIELTEDEIIFNNYVSQVVGFLLNLKTSYVNNDNLLGFETRLERAYTRVEDKIAEGAEGRLLLILNAIKNGIVKVLQG